MFRVTKRLLLISAVALLLLLGASNSGGNLSPKTKLLAPHRYDVIGWEIGHLPDKWWHRLFTLLPGGIWGDEERTEAVDEYFALGDEMRRTQGEMQIVVALSEAQRERSPEEVQRQVDEMEERRSELQPIVEEALEAEVTTALRDLGIITRLGPLRWPPVDITFESSPLVLVTSPREQVQRLPDVTLRPELDLLKQEEIEVSVEEMEGVTALVVRIGGLATYPASISPSASLHDAVVLASHEWLHHHLFFHPLGRSYWSSGDLASINETVANIAGREIGDRIFTKLTGQVVERPPYQPPLLEPREEPESGAFDFNREMRLTRLRLDELLAAGSIDEAEVYLQQRRLLFVENGHPIRKLNQAYFAFFGTYADSPASISPIEPQLQAIRSESSGLDEFLERVSRITSASQLEQMARTAGWEPV